MHSEPLATCPEHLLLFSEEWVGTRVQRQACREDATPKVMQRLDVDPGGGWVTPSGGRTPPGCG